MKISMCGYDKSVTTFLGEDLINGDVVKMSGNLTVAKATSSDEICGVVISAEKGYASVQTRGYVELPCSGMSDLGYLNIVADGSGGVTEGSGSHEVLVVSLENGVAGIVL